MSVTGHAHGNCELCDQLEIERAVMEDEVEDWRKSAKRAAEEPCGDEKHCACVGLLREMARSAGENLDLQYRLAAKAILREAEALKARDEALKGVAYLENEVRRLLTIKTPAPTPSAIRMLEADAEVLRLSALSQRLSERIDYLTENLRRRGFHEPTRMP